MVEVVVERDRAVRGDRVGVGVVGGGVGEPARVVEPDERAPARRVVVDHVQEHGDAPGVGGVDERLELVGRPVAFVEGEVEPDVVTPTVVAVRLGDGHELDGVDAEPVEVVQRVRERGEAPVAGEVADEELVDDELPERRGLEALVGPRERGRPRREQADGVVDGAVGVAGFAGVDHLGRVRIGHADLAVDPVLEGHLGPGREPGDLGPPPRPERVRRVPEHQRVVVGRPAVEVAERVDEPLARGAEDEPGARGVGGIVGDPVLEPVGDGGVGHVAGEHADLGRRRRAPLHHGVDPDVRAGRDRAGEAEAVHPVARVLGHRRGVDRLVDREPDGGHVRRPEHAGRDRSDLVGPVLLAGDLEHHGVGDPDDGVVVGPGRLGPERVREPRPVGAQRVPVDVHLVGVAPADGERRGVAVLVLGGDGRGLARGAGRDPSGVVGTPVVERARHERPDDGLDLGGREVREEPERHVDGLGAGGGGQDGEEEGDEGESGAMHGRRGWVDRMRRSDRGFRTPEA